ncbi:radical SAM protein [Candidatus Thorarchaeota archaeon]|nr:MAG: radical SAM protein [Candidatus Thorarchaeota archaeon]
MVSDLVREYNTVIKDRNDVNLSFGFAYPSTYRAGMTSLATHLFYFLINSRPDASCERYFRFQVPSPAESVESGRSLRDNHIIGFSLTYEEDIINIIQMLRAGRVPIESKNRTDQDPVVIAGGPASSANPEPYAQFFDAFVIGEGEYVINDILDMSSKSNSREDVIENFAHLEGVYVPSITQGSVSRQIVANLNDSFHPTAQIVPDVPEDSTHAPVFGRSLLVEVSRGCGHSCKFCLVGHVCKPRRIRSTSRLKEIISEGMQKTPIEKVALIASSLGEGDNLAEIAKWIVDQGLKLSVPSMRADAVSEDILLALKEGGQRTLTIAPEAGSSRLRQEIGKGLSDEEINRAVFLADKIGMYAVKAYFIIGLPEESDEDIDAIGKMMKDFANASNLKLTASVNPFVPKAHTKWQRHAQPTLPSLRRKIKLLQHSLNNIPRVDLETLDPRKARIQAALSLGDQSLGAVIARASEYGGLGGWRRAEKETGVEFFSVANDAERLKGELPWSFIKA